MTVNYVWKPGYDTRPQGFVASYTVSYTRAAYDSLVVLAMTVATFLVTKRAIRNHPFQISLKTLLACAATVATYAGLAGEWGIWWKVLLDSVSCLVILAAITMTYAAILDLLGLAVQLRARIGRWVLGRR